MTHSFPQFLRRIRIPFKGLIFPAILISSVSGQFGKVVEQPKSPQPDVALAKSDDDTPRTCGELLIAVFRERIFAGHPHDKWKHCYASCLIARKCDPMIAGTLGILKECMDFVGTVAYRIATRMRGPPIAIRLAAKLRGDPEVMDLVADGRGIAAAFTENACSASCDGVYP